MPTNPNIDIIAQIIEQVLNAKPTDSFCKSIQTQYFERGGLSKKQLEGLLGKAQRIETIPIGKLATLEAIIKKKHITHKSIATTTKKSEEIDTQSPKIIEQMLQKYPTHKRVLVLKFILEKDKKLSQSEKDELLKFFKLLKIER